MLHLSCADARWQALQQLGACGKAAGPEPSGAAPCMPLWEALTSGTAGLLQVGYPLVWATLIAHAASMDTDPFGRHYR